MSLTLLAIVALVLASIGLIAGAIASVTPAGCSAVSRGRRMSRHRRANRR